jgi:hypothetical protein
VGNFPTSENGMFESGGIKKFKEEKIFEIVSEHCVTIETEILKTRKKAFLVVGGLRRRSELTNIHTSLYVTTFWNKD